MTRVEVLGEFDTWTRALTGFATRKGHMPSDRFRAYRYNAPGHRGADPKLKGRELRMALGVPPAGSSPAKEEVPGLNRDGTRSPKDGAAKR
jgi:hypothetical protein